MPEREHYQPQSPEGRIAKTVEEVAAREFGPEKLTRADVAKCLNLSAEQISDEEWQEISEFAVNAGSDLIRASIPERVDPISKKQEGAIKRSIDKGEARFVPYHDLFHAAETYRLTEGREASSAFIKANDKDRYTDPAVVQAELYPLLFLSHERSDSPLPIWMGTKEGRQHLLETFSLPDSDSKELEELLLKEPSADAQGRRTEYESLIEIVLVENAKRRVPDITQAELDDVRQAFRQVRGQPPAHYEQFAPKVFNQEWQDNPRLFLDEFLENIRVKPE